MAQALDHFEEALKEQFYANTGKGTRPGPLIDSATVLVDGTRLGDVTDLKRYLVEQKGRTFVRHLTRRLLSYALGRELAFPDERVVEGILEQLERDGFGARTLVRAIVASEPFRFRNFP